MSCVLWPPASYRKAYLGYPFVMRTPPLQPSMLRPCVQRTSPLLPLLLQPALPLLPAHPSRVEFSHALSPRLLPLRQPCVLRPPASSRKHSLGQPFLLRTPPLQPCMLRPLRPLLLHASVRGPFVQRTPPLLPFLLHPEGRLRPVVQHWRDVVQQLQGVGHETYLPAGLVASVQVLGRHAKRLLASAPHEAARFRLHLAEMFPETLPTLQGP